MLTSSETSGTSYSATQTVHECDFCGEAVHRATAIERVEWRGGKAEIVTLCHDCALDD